MNPEYKQRLHNTIDFVKSRTKISPTIGIITGSGMGNFLNEIEGIEIPYADIPGFPKISVKGHPGKLKINSSIAVCGGRFHYYEGHSIEDVVFPVLLLHKLGIKTLVLTNASGGINKSFSSGDLVIITDHLNMLGVNPLREVFDAELGPRFPDISEVYTPALRTMCHDIDKGLKEGVYAAMQGPSYETPAEIKMLKTIGADMVGMSTVPEAITAGFLCMKVIGLSCITNMAAGITREGLTHDEVLATAKKSENRLINLLLGISERLASRK